MQHYQHRLFFLLLWLLQIVVVVLFASCCIGKVHAFDIPTTTPAATAAATRRLGKLCNKNNNNHHGSISTRRRNPSSSSLLAAAQRRRRHNPSTHYSDSTTTTTDDDDDRFRYRFLATCQPGLANVVRYELQRNVDGAFDIRTSGPSAVSFAGHSIRIGLEAMVYTRSTLKILQLVVESTSLSTTSSSSSSLSSYYSGGSTGSITSRYDLYDYVRDAINVEELLLSSSSDDNNNNKWLSLSVTVVRNNIPSLPRDLTHSYYTAQTIQNALFDAVDNYVTMDVDRSSMQHDGSSNNNNDDGHQEDEQRRRRRLVQMVPPNVADVPLVVYLRGDTESRTTLDDVPTASIAMYKQLHHGSLHKRGYRRPTTIGRPSFSSASSSTAKIHKASMKESMAAGLLLSTEHDLFCTKPTNHNQSSSSSSSLSTTTTSDTTRTTTLVDPMVGSGTLLVEAIMIMADIAPELMRIKCNSYNGDDDDTRRLLRRRRPPPVLQWTYENGDNVMTLYGDVLQNATRRAKTGWQRLCHDVDSGRLQVIANDSHDGALELLHDSLYNAGFQDVVQVHHNNCQHLNIIPPTPMTTGTTIHNGDYNNKDDDDDDERHSSSHHECLVVTNPPWGIRLDDDDHGSWEALRVFLRHNCPPNDTTAWILSGNKGATKHLGLKRSTGMALESGPVQLKWLQYKIYDKNSSNNDDANKEGASVLDASDKEERDGLYSPRWQRQEQRQGTRDEQPVRYTPRRTSSVAAKTSHQQGKRSIRGGYNKRRRHSNRDRASNENDNENESSNNKSITTPLTAEEREERKKSWYL